MIEFSDVRSQFITLTGMNQTESMKWSHIIAKSVSDVKDIVDSSRLTEEVVPRLSHAAAALAYYRYVVHSLTKENVSAFNIGDIKMAQNISDMLTVAREIRDDALSSLDDLRPKTPFGVKSV